MASIDYLQRFPQSILNRSADSNLGKLWKIFADQLDDVEDSAADVKAMLDIDDAEGTQLDMIGTIVLLDRIPGQSDADYRLNLKIAIFEKISGGSIPDIIEVSSLVTSADEIRIREEFPANVIIWIQSDAGNYSIEKIIIKRVMAAGVGLTLTQTTDTPFVFEGDPDGEGFNEYGEDVGGELSEVF